MGKKYAKTKKIGNKGSAYIEYLMTDYCLMHRIDESKDLGNDYLCEWVFEENPCGVLFLSQIKTRTAITGSRKIKIKTINEVSPLNGLKEVKITNARCKIDKDTMDYWRGLEIPAFLFLLVYDENRYRCFYKRFTAVLHSKNKQKNEKFYEVQDAGQFLAFKDVGGKRMLGFARDLFIDYIRCNYMKGSLVYKNPRELGLEQFPEGGQTKFIEFINEYKEAIKNNLSSLAELGITLESNKKYSSVSHATSSSTGTTTLLVEDEIKEE